MAATEYSPAGGSAKYVDIANMVTCLENIGTQITNAMSAIEAYSAQAPSLGSSTFRPTVEGNLRSIKSSYETNLVPVLQKIQTDIEAVKSEYSTRASNIEGAGSTPAAGRGATLN